MANILYPTQKIVEKYLPQIFPGLTLGCLSPSIRIIGKIAQYHTTPGKYGILPVNVQSITGVDIPILVDDNEANNSIVAIIAQDPLRSKTDPMLAPFSPFNDPIVGTPFAYHYNASFYPRTDVYRRVIDGLLKKGYRVYITDIWKSWDNDKPKKTRMGKWSNINPHKQCLEEEFTHIKPYKVILMGNEAQNKYESINYPVKPIAVPHPSNANNGNWTKIGVGTSPQDKADYIVSKV